MFTGGSGILRDIEQLIANHHRFIQYNTGDTNDATQDFFVVNNQGVLANNRHFINFTRQEYQPNGDSTTEGRSLHILGYIYTYLATRNMDYLHWAEWYCEAYFKYFYRGQPIPDTPQRWVCNWIINGKEPVPANFPLSTSSVPTQGGFKAIPFEFVNGVTQIPAGAPHWGEWLDLARFAFPNTATVSWDSLNAAIRPMTPDGGPDWSQSAITPKSNFLRCTLSNFSIARLRSSSLRSFDTV